MKLRFLTKNKHKAAEFQKLFEGTPCEIIPDGTQIEEIQTEDMEALVRDKVVKAFDRVRWPIFVDHTGLHLDLLNRLPGGLTELFWNGLKNPGLAEFVGKSPKPGVTAVTYIGYCDGRRVYLFKGELRGTIAAEPRGDEGFQWDPVFIPDGETQTFAEMGADRKNKLSMRRLAIEEFARHLKVKIL